MIIDGIVHIYRCPRNVETFYLSYIPEKYFSSVRYIQLLSE